LQVKFDTEEYEGHRFVKMDFWLHGVPKNVGNVLRESVMQTVSYARMVFLSVADMLSGRFGLADISGPVGAVSYVSQAVKTSAYSALRLMAILTINVGLFNLFPIPALDGWRVVLVAGGGDFGMPAFMQRQRQRYGTDGAERPGRPTGTPNSGRSQSAHDRVHRPYDDRRRTDVLRA